MGLLLFIMALVAGWVKTTLQSVAFSNALFPNEFLLF